LIARERYYVETLDCINKIIPERTNQEYKKDDKEKIKQQVKQYQEVNKQNIKDQKKNTIISIKISFNKEIRLTIN
jgi:hypothetical protein